MLTIKYQARFKKDFKLADSRGYNMSLLEEVIQKLANQEELDPKYRDHSLSGKYSGLRECHITPDWLLMYEIKESELVLLLNRTGTHSDLFKK